MYTNKYPFGNLFDDFFSCHGKKIRNDETKICKKLLTKNIDEYLYQNVEKIYTRRKSLLIIFVHG